MILIKTLNYFEMLKNLSSLNYEMFCKILNNQPISKEKIDFNSFQEEIYNSLLGEFISPIEREDIFILQKRLEEEFLEICSFSLFKTDKASYSVDVEEVLRNNVAIFSELKNFKKPKKLLKLIKENKKSTINIIIPKVKTIKNSEEVKIAKLVYKTDIEIERIVLNNN